MTVRLGEVSIKVEVDTREAFEKLAKVDQALTKELGGIGVLRDKIRQAKSEMPSGGTGPSTGGKPAAQAPIGRSSMAQRLQSFTPRKSPSGLLKGAITGAISSAVAKNPVTGAIIGAATQLGLNKLGKPQTIGAVPVGAGAAAMTLGAAAAGYVAASTTAANAPSVGKLFGLADDSPAMEFLEEMRAKVLLLEANVTAVFTSIQKTTELAGATVGLTGDFPDWTYYLDMNQKADMISGALEKKNRLEMRDRIAEGVGESMNRVFGRSSR